MHKVLLLTNFSRAQCIKSMHFVECKLFPENASKFFCKDFVAVSLEVHHCRKLRILCYILVQFWPHFGKELKFGIQISVSTRLTTWGVWLKRGSHDHIPGVREPQKHSLLNQLCLLHKREGTSVPPVFAEQNLSTTWQSWWLGKIQICFLELFRID